MAQRPGPPVVDPDGDAFMADGQIGTTKSEQDDLPHSYYMPSQTPGFQFPPNTLTNPSVTGENPLALPFDRTWHGYGYPATPVPNNVTYLDHTSFEPDFPFPFGDLRYLPPPHPSTTNQPQAFRPSIETGTVAPADLQSRPGFQQHASSNEPPTSGVAVREQSTLLPRLSTILPGHMHINRERQHPTDLNNMQQSSTIPLPFNPRDSLELIEEGLRRPLNGLEDSPTSSDSEPASLIRNDLTIMADRRAPRQGLRAAAPAPAVVANPTSPEGNETAIVPVNRAPHQIPPRPRHRRRMSRPTTPRVACTACMEDFRLDDLLNLACSCRYCTPCLNAAFRAGCTSKAAFPPKCCGRPLRISVWGGMLDKDILERYKMIEAEFSATRPLYCATPTCSTFIPEHQQLHSQELGFCLNCSKTTCRRCRQDLDKHTGNEHTGRICPAADAEVAALFALGSAKKWRQCPTCLNMVERIEGCNHMDCVCGVEFCYRCGMLFDEDDNCACRPSSWEDDDDDDEDGNGNGGENEEADGDGETDGAAAGDGNGNGTGNEETGDSSEVEELWPNFRLAVDASGRPACLHWHTESLGAQHLPCHGCLRERRLRSCNDCGVELCRECVANVRRGTGSRSSEHSDDE